MPDLRRILLTGDAVGGVWRYSLELARGLAEREIAPVLAVLGPPPTPEQMAEARRIRGLRLIITGLPLEWTAATEVELRETGAALAGLAGRLDADTVHLHTPALAAEVAWSMPVVAVNHSDVGTWWQAVRGGSMPDDLAWKAAAVGRGLAEADAVLTPSRSLARAVERLYRPGRRIEVVHNGRTPAKLRPHTRCRAVLAAGRLWDEAKNIMALERVAQRLDAPVLAAGPLAGPNGAGAGITHLRMLGPLPDPMLASAMAQATVFVAPARYEPFGLSVLEAAQAGMALALADIPSFRELWDGVALFFHPEDAEGLAKVLHRLLDRPDGPGERARAHAARYNAPAMVEATLAVHRELVGRKAA